MGKHRRPSQRRVSWPAVLGALGGVVVLIGVLLLVTGRWSTSADPVGDDPVPAFAVVLASAPCTQAGGSTTVQVTTASGPVRAELSACGHQVGDRLAVEHRRDEPTRVRVAGTSVGGTAAWSMALPLTAAGAAVLAVAAGAAVVPGARGPHARTRPRPHRRPHPRPGRSGGSTEVVPARG
ncbi:hypothetical protein [Nakamurella leprariae]|uniref:Uncharacterized protein n=1 Tax=Nakamurella leprariae TaxID=2803911 RepID=A0A938YGC2_9ACTN|nr:hypothetical protein [Nakamurella leprariae]MBM9467313.1 hypothetical protein [Nakamurella leprariae]